MLSDIASSREKKRPRLDPVVDLKESLMEANHQWIANRPIELANGKRVPAGAVFRPINQKVEENPQEAREIPTPAFSRESPILSSRQKDAAIRGKTAGTSGETASLQEAASCAYPASLETNQSVPASGFGSNSGSLERNTQLESSTTETSLNELDYLIAPAELQTIDDFFKRELESMGTEDYSLLNANEYRIWDNFLDGFLTEDIPVEVPMPTTGTLAIGNPLVMSTSSSPFADLRALPVPGGGGGMASSAMGGGGSDVHEKTSMLPVTMYQIAPVTDGLNDALSNRSYSHSLLTGANNSQTSLIDPMAMQSSVGSAMADTSSQSSAAQHRSMVLPIASEEINLHLQQMASSSASSSSAPPQPTTTTPASILAIPGTVPAPVLAPRKKRHTSKEHLSEAEKRANHIASEQKRRQNIKLGFEALAKLNPVFKVPGGDGGRPFVMPPKVAIITQSKP